MKDLIAKLHSDSADQILATFSTLEMQLQGFAKSSYEKDLRIAELEAQIAAKPADTDIPEALELLAAVFDAWENGDDCYEDPGECAGFLGKAFRLDDDIFNRCVELLNRRNPPRNAASTALQAPVREVPGWQPIETAPKDGQEILIRYPLQGNVKQLASYNTIHNHWQSKGGYVWAVEQKCEWHPLPDDLPASPVQEPKP